MDEYRALLRLIIAIAISVIQEIDYEEWLDPSTKSDRLKAMLKPVPESETHLEIVEK